MLVLSLVAGAGAGGTSWLSCDGSVVVDADADDDPYISSRFRGCSSSRPRSAGVAARLVALDLDTSDGVGDSSRGGVTSVLCRDVDIREARCEKNDPIPAPHELNDDRASTADGSWGGACGEEATRLSGRIPLGWVGGGCGDDSGLPTKLTDSRPERILAASDLETSTRLLDALVVCSVAAPDAFEDVLALRCIHRPRTPSTALKKPVDPAVNVREMASLVGASC